MSVYNKTLFTYGCMCSCESVFKISTFHCNWIVVVGCFSFSVNLSKDNEIFTSSHCPLYRFSYLLLCFYVLLWEIMRIILISCVFEKNWIYIIYPYLILNSWMGTGLTHLIYLSPMTCCRLTLKKPQIRDAL